MFFSTCAFAQESDEDVVAALCGSQHGTSVHTIVVIGCVQHYGANTVVLHTQVDAEDECHDGKHQILLYCIGPKWTRRTISVRIFCRIISDELMNCEDIW